MTTLFCVKVYVKFVVSRTAKDIQMTTSEKVFYNNALSIPIVLGMASLNGEMPTITGFNYVQLIESPSLILAYVDHGFRASIVLSQCLVVPIQ